MKKKTFTKAWFTGFTSNVAGVIIGILLTFGITFLIQHRQEQRQTKHLLSMIKDELELHIEQLEKQKNYLIDEYAGSRALMPYLTAVETLPADTLQKYMEVVNQVQKYATFTTALDVFKNSSQIQAFSNKELISELFGIYSTISNFYNNLNGSVTDHKDKGMRKDLEEIDIAQETDISQGTGIFFVKILKSNIIIRNYIIMLVNGHCEYMVKGTDELAAKIKKVITMIDEEIE